MAIVQEVQCDMCGNVLTGQKGIHKISKSYLEFAGFMRDWQATPNSTWREQTYISPPDKRQMAFCTENDATCLQDYVVMKRESQRVRREQELREGATAEHMDRLAGGSTYTPKRYGAPPPSAPPMQY